MVIKMKMNKALIDATLKINKTNILQKAIASYKDGSKQENYHIGLTSLILKQPDLLNVTSRFASEGANKNREVFLKCVLAKAWETPRNKFVDFEHDPNGTNYIGTDWEGKNPDKYHIVGHIWDSALMTQDGDKIPPEEIYIDTDGQAFKMGSVYRNSKLDILVSWVLYQWEFEDLAELIQEQYNDGADGDFGVSMEVLYSDYKYRVGEFDVNETFEYDSNKDGILEAKKGTAMGNILHKYWQDRKEYNGKPVYRILGGTLFFSGMGIVRSRGERRAINLSVASHIGSYLQKTSASSREIDVLIKSVASKNTNDFSKCSIQEDGLPSCACMEENMIHEIDSTVSAAKSLAAKLTEKSEAIKKRKDVNSKEGTKKYGKVKFADSLNHKYPIDTDAHIRAAWSYIHMPKNAAKYSSEDAKKIKSRIASAWRKKIDKVGPPSVSKAGFSFGCSKCFDYLDDQNISSGSEEFDDDHINDHINQIDNNLKIANKLLINLYDDNIDNKIDEGEMLDYMDELDQMVYESKSFFNKIK